MTVSSGFMKKLFGLIVAFVLLFYIYFYTSRYFYCIGCDAIILRDKFQMPKASNPFYNMSDIKSFFEIKCTAPLILMILIRTNDTRLRDTIRQTWGQWISRVYRDNLRKTSCNNQLNKIHYHARDIQLKFVSSPSESNARAITRDLELLESEHKIFHDIVYLNSPLDRYMNLTLKTLSGLWTIYNSCPNVLTVMKLDTDTFVNIPQLLLLWKHLKIVAKKSPIIIGNKQSRPAVVRNPNNKWYLSKEKFPSYIFYHKNESDFFPDYMTGCGYIITRPAMKDILINAQSFLYQNSIDKLFYWEDVAITGIYRSETTQLQHTGLIRFENSMASIDVCSMSNLILAHRISENKLCDLWQQLSQLSDKYYYEATNQTSTESTSSNQNKPMKIACQLTIEDKLKMIFREITDSITSFIM